jgi:transglutaminase-like putative cysteine protease
VRLRLLHHRLAIGMGLAGLVAFAGGAGFEPVAVFTAGACLVAALFWQPEPGTSTRLQRAFAVFAVVLVARAAYAVLAGDGDRLVPMVDLLLLLLINEALKPAERANDVRIYILSFALLLAATVYRPGLLFALAFVAYVGVSTLALMIGQLRRTSERYGVRDVGVGRGFLAGTGALSIVTLTVSAVLFLAFPRVSRGWLPGGRGFTTTVAGFGNEVSLAAYGASIRSNPEIVLRVEFPDGTPLNVGSLHWRGRSYDHFDGVRWSRSEDLPPSAPSFEWYRQRRTGPIKRQDIYGSMLTNRVLFGIHPVVGVRPLTHIRPVADNAGDLRFFGRTAPAYEVNSFVDPPTPEQLRGAPDGGAPASSYYLQLPSLPRRVFGLADSLTAGLHNRYDRVMAIERWLKTNFRYTLQLPATPQQATLEYFLFQRRAGHCEYFSTAMAVLLRAVGIPTRNVNGFLGGEWNSVGRFLAVTQNQAHSWVEVWFPRFGWVTFDPTPSAGPGSDAAALSWWWPGRFLLDGLEHRWNKWVLDYNLGTQVALLDRTTRLFSDQGKSSGPSAPHLPKHLLWVLAGVGALIAVIAAFSARPARRRAETRYYLKLRRAYGAAGYRLAPPGAALGLLSALDAQDAPGLGDARRLVEIYLARRFGGTPAGPTERASMAAHLKVAVGALRRRKRRRGSRSAQRGVSASRERSDGLDGQGLDGR